MFYCFKKVGFLQICIFFCDGREKLKTMVMLPPQNVVVVLLKCSLLFGSRIKTELWSRLNLVLMALPSSLQTLSGASCSSAQVLRCDWVTASATVGVWLFWGGKTAVLKLFKRSYLLRERLLFFPKSWFLSRYFYFRCCCSGIGMGRSGFIKLFSYCLF